MRAVLPKNITVLVADDAAAVRALCRRLLQSEGYNVILAEDGPSALAAVRLHAPDIVLLDVQMPEPGGLEVCRRLKADPSTRLMPVILMTGETELEDRIHGIEAGPDDILSKPFHASVLRARVESLSRSKCSLDELDSAAVTLSSHS